MGSNGTWVMSGYKAGDLLILDFGSGIAHIAICEMVNADGSFATIEGNTSTLSDDNGGAVMARKRYLRNIVGACRPAYSATMTAAKVLAIARAEIGTREYPADSNKVKYNTAYYGREVSGAAYPWCVAFVWWCFMTAGMSALFYGGGKTAGCTTLARFYGYGKSVVPTSVLGYGSKGGDVVTLQNRLNALKYRCGSADGDFGPRTREAVKAFQAAKGLVVDGVVGSRTWARLYN